MTTSRAWMPFFIGDYKRDTGHLTTLEHGAYLLLIMHYWEKGPLPNDDARLARIAGVSLKQWSSLREIVISFFVEANAKQLLRHKRIDEELTKAEITSQKRALAGYKGGLASRGKTNQERNYLKAIAKQTGDHSHSHKNLTYLRVTEAARKRTSEEER